MQSREAYIALNLVPGLGAASVRLLADRLRSPEAAFEAKPAELRQILGRYATEDVLAGIRAVADGKALQQELARAREACVRILTIEDADYPKLLKQIHAPPPVIYVKGTLLPEDEAAVAIVGTRAATLYGLENAGWFGEDLARCGVTVVSGLAEGVDRAAHEGALKAGGRTIAVVGHGLSTVYPAHHRDLAERVAKSGCLISEFPMWMEPARANFPRRNRIISGLSLGVLVVEAPVQSGALITAHAAMEQGREVFAMPGPISSSQSRGANDLLKDGAKLVCQVRDILEELAPHLKETLRTSASARAEEAHEELVEGSRLTSEESAVFNAVPDGASAGLEAMVRATALQPARLMSVLTGLELKGLVRQTVGRGFSRAN